jgi:cephalosporin hydroxylase
MSLLELINNNLTDKNTCHSYIDTYESLFNKRRLIVSNVLEIGIQKGGSIKLWNDYFLNANIYGIDIMEEDNNINSLLENKRINLYTSTNAYNEDFVRKEFIEKNVNFDILIDDGPHTLESMIQFIKIYHKILKNDGLLIIEDVPDIEWINILKDSTPVNLRKYIYVYDLRHIKGRWDDILFVIDLKNSLV